MVSLVVQLKEKEDILILYFSPMCTQTIKICWKNILYEEKIKKVWVFDNIELYNYCNDIMLLGT